MSTDRLARAIFAIDATNQADPNRVTVDGRDVAKEVLYAERMTDCLHKLVDAPSEALQIATRAQHIARWEIPRDRYAMDRKGYHQWRIELQRHHAELTARILEEVGYGADVIERVGDLLQKKSLKRDAEVQTLEDIACLVFLEHYFDGFAAAHDDEKLVRILEKTWQKMSPRGQSAALELPLSDRARSLVSRALG